MAWLAHVYLRGMAISWLFPSGHHQTQPIKINNLSIHCWTPPFSSCVVRKPRHNQAASKAAP
jgi:hypothetical protein